MLGYRPEDLVGHAVFEFLDPNCIQNNKDAFDSAATKHAEKIRFVSCWRNREGVPVRLESHATPHYTADGKFAGFFGIDRVVRPDTGS